MRCLNCGNPFYPKRLLKDLFQTKKEYLCDLCRNKYPLFLQAKTVPLFDKTLKILSLFAEKTWVCYDAYFWEVSQIVPYFLFKPNYFVLFLDEVYISDWLIAVFDWLSSCVEKQVLLITFYVKN